MAERIFKVIGRADMIDDPKFLTNEDRVKNRLEVDEAVGGWIGMRTLEECMEVFERESVTVAPVYDIEQIMADPHFRDRGTLQPMRHSLVDEPVEDGVTVGFPIKFSSGPLPQMRGAPTLGMVNEDVFGRLLDLGAEEIQALKDKGVV